MIGMRPRRSSRVFLEDLLQVDRCCRLFVSCGSQRPRSVDPLPPIVPPPPVTVAPPAPVADPSAPASDSTQSTTVYVCSKRKKKT